MFGRKSDGLQSLNIPKKWLVVYCLAVCMILGVLFSLGYSTLGLLVLGAAFCIFAAGDVLTGLLKRRQVGKLRTFFAVFAILGAFGGIAILLSAYFYLCA